MNIPLDKARRYADQLVDQLTPYSHRIAIAGSIRRCRPVVHDIDLVLVPKDITALKKRCTQRCITLANGDRNFSIQATNGLQIDIFFAHLGRKELFQQIPSNWGSILLCRTGSKQHNQRIALAAKAQGKRWAPYIGIVDKDGRIAAETEAALYAALNLPFLEPEQREH